MRTAARLLLVCLLSAVVIPAARQSAEAQSAVLYDDFNTLFINGAKWYGLEDPPDPTLPFPQGATEIFRGAFAGELVMSHRINGNPVNDSINAHWMRLNLRNPDPVTLLQAKITVRAYQLQACPTNPEAGAVRIRLNGVFFRPATNAPGDLTDAGIGRVEIFRLTGSADPSNVFRIRARLARCIDPNCSDVEFLDTKDLGTVNVGQSTTVSVRWNKASTSILFRRDRNPEVQVVYPLSDDGPGGNKGMILTSFTPNCTTPTVASILATFDNFYINP